MGWGGVGRGVLYLHVCAHTHDPRSRRYHGSVSSFPVPQILCSLLWCPSLRPSVCLIIADGCSGLPFRPILTYCIIICLCVALCRGAFGWRVRSRPRRVRRAAAGAIYVLSALVARSRCALPVSPCLGPPLLLPAFCIARALQHHLHAHQLPLLPPCPLYGCPPVRRRVRRQSRAPSSASSAGVLLLWMCTSVLPPPAARHCPGHGSWRTLA